MTTNREVMARNIIYYMEKQGVTATEVCNALGGWNTDNIMKSTYRHAMNEDEVKETIASNFSFL